MPHNIGIGKHGIQRVEIPAVSSRKKRRGVSSFIQCFPFPAFYRFKFLSFIVLNFIARFILPAAPDSAAPAFYIAHTAPRTRRLNTAPPAKFANAA